MRVTPLLLGGEGCWVEMGYKMTSAFLLGWERGGLPLFSPQQGSLANSAIENKTLRLVKMNLLKVPNEKKKSDIIYSHSC